MMPTLLVLCICNRRHYSSRRRRRSNPLRFSLFNCRCPSSILLIATGVIIPLHGIGDDVVVDIIMMQMSLLTTDQRICCLPNRVQSSTARLLVPWSSVLLPLLEVALGRRLESSFLLIVIILSSTGVFLVRGVNRSNVRRGTSYRNVFRFV